MDEFTFRFSGVIVQGQCNINDSSITAEDFLQIFVTKGMKIKRLDEDHRLIDGSKLILNAHEHSVIDELVELDV